MRRRAPAWPAAGDDQAGFTIVEVVLAFVLLLVVALPSAEFINNEMSVSGNVRNDVVAANLATQALETARNAAAASFTTFTSDVDGTPSTATQQVGGVTYTVTTTKRWQVANLGAAGCTASGAAAGAVTASLVLVQALVQWPHMGGQPAIHAETLVSQPLANGPASNGTFQLQVLNAASQGSSGVPVIVTPSDSSGHATGSGATYYTDANGCLVGNEPAGYYTLTLSKSGWVGPQENTTESETGAILISAGQSTSAATLDYDAGGTVNVQLASDPTLPPTPIGLPVTVANTTLTPGGTATFQLSAALSNGAPASPPVPPSTTVPSTSTTVAPTTTAPPGPKGGSTTTSTTTTTLLPTTTTTSTTVPVTTTTTVAPPGPTATSGPIGPLYPYSNGYQVWLGDCPDSQPTAAPVATPAPGGATNVSVGTDVLTVHATSHGQPVAGYYVRVTPASCNDPDAPTNGYLLPGVTNALGVITASMPYGSWTVSLYATATSSTAVGASPTVTMAPALPPASVGN